MHPNPSPLKQNCVEEGENTRVEGEGTGANQAMAALESDVKARFAVSNGLRSHSRSGGLDRSNVCAWILTIGPPVGERTGG